MYLIQQITDQPSQTQNLILPDGTTLDLSIYFMPMQLAWFITSLVYGVFTLQGFRIINSPNILHQYRNQIPFGLGCFSNNNRDPSLQQDFSSGNSKLYILSSAEVAQFNQLLSNESFTNA